MKIIFTILLGFAFHGVIAQENFDPVKITSRKITDNIYMLQGAGETLPY